MPYPTNADVPDYVPEGKKSQWREVWNSSYSRALDEGDSKEKAEASAFAQANAVAGPGAKKAMDRTHILFRKFIQFTKVDEINRTVSGVITSETPDKTGEICDYESSKPYYQEWSQEISDATGGRSLGNVRAQHDVAQAVGKFIDLLYDDDNKRILGTAKIVDQACWEKCVEGVFTGFSHGGEYIGTLKTEGKYKRYTAAPSEVSVVDNPCNPDAHFEYVKADGTIELRKFHPTEQTTPTPQAGFDKPASPVSGLPTFNVAENQIHEDSPKKDEEEEIDMKKEEVQEMIRAGIAEALSKTEDLCPTCHRKAGECKCSEKPPAPEAAKVGKTADASLEKAKADPRVEKAVYEILKATMSKKAGVDLGKAVDSSLQKGMNTVRTMADILLQLAWLKWSVTQEQDVEGEPESPLPEALIADITKLADTLVLMVGEETREVVEMATAGKPPYESTCHDQTCFSCPPMCCTIEGITLVKASLTDEEEAQLAKAATKALTLEGSSIIKASGYDEHEDPKQTACACSCPSCAAGKCDECSGVLCHDVNCHGCPVQDRVGTNQLPDDIQLYRASVPEPRTLKVSGVELASACE